MERLTFDGNFCDIAQCREPCKHDGSCSQKQVWERLKEYEDAGLSPQACAEAREAGKVLSSCDVSFSRLAQLLTADKDGRVEILPCKCWLDLVFGTQVLFWGIDEDGPEKSIREISVDDSQRIAWDDGYDTVYLIGYDDNGDRWEFPPDEVGKTVFRTPEEAEKALQKMEGKA